MSVALSPGSAGDQRPGSLRVPAPAGVAGVVYRGAGWLGQSLRELAHGLLDSLYVPRCVSCGLYLDGQERDLCPGCRQAVIAVPQPLCDRCGLPVADDDAAASSPGSLCDACRDTPPPYRRARARAIYGGPLEDSIVQLKFHDRPGLARPLARLLLAGLPPGIDPATLDLLLPVPLHPRRLRQRGYNQAALLTAALAGAWRVPWSPTLLRRLRDTPPQSGLGRQERQVNLQGAFALRSFAALAGKRVLLIDDVITTGSTVAECARVLLAAGTTTVDALALARALPERMLG